MITNTYKEYRDQWARASNGEITAAPTHIDLELSSACNYRCGMCPQAEPEVAFKKAFMNYRLAVKLLHEAKSIGVKSIKLNWRGESVLHPQFPGIVFEAVNLGFCETMLNTNGSYTDVLVEQAVLSIDTVIFSVDSLKEDVAARIRPGGPLSDVIRNVAAAVTSKELYKTPKKIRINFTRQKENWDELPAMEKFCAELGIDLNTRPVFPRNPPKTGMYYDASKTIVMGRKNCGFPFQRLVIAWDGMVAPCCVPWTNDLFVGDVTRQSLKEVWEGMELARIRQDALSADYKHPTCINCTSWQSYNVVHTL